MLLPLPDRPITTKVSPRATEKLTSRTPTVQPVAASTSLRLAPSWAIAIASAGRGPNTFHTLRTSTAGVPAVSSALIARPLTWFDARAPLR